jgi:hypothetical protein
MDDVLLVSLVLTGACVLLVLALAWCSADPDDR